MVLLKRRLLKLKHAVYRDERVLLKLILRRELELSRQRLRAASKFYRLPSRVGLLRLHYVCYQEKASQPKAKFRWFIAPTKSVLQP
jgi:hypothetical protein